MKIIYTSILGCPKTQNNKLEIEELDNSNGFVDALKHNLIQTKKLMFITNRWQTTTPKEQPKDEVFNDYHYTNQEYANAVRDCYALSGINFEQMVVVDCNYQGDFEHELLTSDLVFVQAGHTPRGLKILNQLNFKQHIKNFKGVLLLTGTAAKLVASKVLSTHHGNINEYEIEDGLNLRPYSIRPYFSYSLKMKFDKKFKVRLFLLKQLSKQLDVYALGANSFIIDNGTEIKIVNECHLIKKGHIKKICNKNQTISLQNTESSCCYDE